MNHFFKLALASALSLSAITTAVADSGHSAEHDAASVSAASSMTDGEVKKVNKDTGKITIKHGPLVNLDMPGMTMLFHVSDPAMLDQVKQGDKIKFEAKKINGAFTVMKLETLK